MAADDASPLRAVRRTTSFIAWLLACGIFCLLLTSLVRGGHAPMPLVGGMFLLAAVSAWRPDIGLLLLAAFVPIAARTSRYVSEAVAWPEVLVVAFAAGYSARNLRPRRLPPDGLTLPAFTLTAIVVASLAVRLVVLFWTIGGTLLGQQLWQSGALDYFVARSRFGDLDAAMRLIEGMLLLRAAATASRADPGFSPRLVRWFVAGAAAAAALNLSRVWEGALRLESPLTAFLRYLLTLRYNVHYPDVNAAGSYFVMALLPAIALAAGRRRVWWAAAVVAISSSLMLSGSRAALVSGGLSALVWGAWRLKDAGVGRASRRWVIAIPSLLLIAGAAAAVYYVSAGRNPTPSSTALQVRVELARTTFRMIATHPAFGVGVGQYPQRSSGYSSPILEQRFGVKNENAHNNFLQILGELGAVGFAAFLWVLGAAAVECFRLLRSSKDLLPQGIVAGLAAFALTWLSGHPLLIDEPALSFWLLLGAVSGWSGGRATSAARRPASRWIPALTAVALAVSVPIRARHDLSFADLEHRGIGLSAWRQGDDGIRYRVAGGSSTVFVPADARVVTIPLRATVPAADFLVEIRLDGRPADIVRVSAERWLMFQLQLPGHADARFRRLDLRVLFAPAPSDGLLAVGSVTPR